MRVPVLVWCSLAMLSMGEAIAAAVFAMPAAAQTATLQGTSTGMSTPPGFTPPESTQAAFVQPAFVQPDASQQAIALTDTAFRASYYEDYYEDYQTPQPIQGGDADPVIPVVPFGTLPQGVYFPASSTVGSSSPEPLPSSAPSLESAPSSAPAAADFPRPGDPPRAIAPGGVVQVPGVPSAPAPLPSSAPIDLGGQTVNVVDVQVVGGTPELQQLVRETVQTQVGGTATASQLQADVDTLLATGFFSNAAVQTTPSGTGSGAGTAVIYQIQPVVVQVFQLTGAQVLSPDVVAQAFQGQIGQPINVAALQQGVTQVNQWYIDNGYPLAQVLSVQPAADGAVTITVIEATVSQVNIQFVDEEGNAVNADGEPINGRTRESFLRDTIQLQSGQVFSEAVARDDLQRLLNLGLFDNATVAVAANGPTVDVTYNLVEQLARRFNLGGGYSTDVGLYGAVTYQDRNFNGIGQQLSANVQLSERGLQYGLRFTNPYRDSHPNRLGYSINAFRRRVLSSTFTDEVNLANGDRIREGRIGGGASVMRPLGDWDAELGLSYSRVSMRDSDGDVFAQDAQGNPLTVSSSGIDDLILLSFQASLDQRDNPANPSRGSLLTLSTEQSIPIGNGNILLNRLRASYAYYVPVNLVSNAFNNETPRLPEVVAFNVQAGTILGDAPPYEAFDLGGADSVRGYGYGRLGTGRSYALASVEYRFPIFSPVGGVLFADFSSDLGSASDVIGEPAVVRDKPGSGFGVGLGLRVNSPFGLMRLDFGVNDQGDNELHFTFGQRF